MSQGMQDPEVGKGQENSLSYRALQKEAMPILSVKPNETSHLQNHKIINLCCFNPLSVWYFVIAAKGN